MKNTIGIILTGGKKRELKEMTIKRTSAAIPVGGKYRAIDFVLSSMVNSGITKVGVITQYNLRSLMAHLGSGKEWDLDRRHGGLYIFPPSLSGDGTGWYRGTADAMYNNLTFLKRSDEDYVIIASGDCIYNMLFDNALQYHIEKDADITIIYKEMDGLSQKELSKFGILEVDNNGRIIDFQEKPLHPASTKCSMGIYIISRKLLMSILEDCAAHGYYDFVMDVIIKRIQTLRIFGYKFSGYWRSINSIESYYKCNMELLQPEVRDELFLQADRKIFTKVKSEVPAKYNEEAEVKNSLVADGCIIEGIVENSILFRGVTVGKNVIIKDSIIMHDTVVEDNVELNCVILDKNVRVTKGKSLKGEKSWPVIVGKRVVV